MNFTFFENNTQRLLFVQTAIAFALAYFVSPWWLAILAIRIDMRD